MRVFIITEGGSNIGIGHITRCISLYQAFEEKGIIPTFVINGDETVRDFLTNKNYEIYNWIEEKEQLFSFIKIADIAIIDSYLADSELYKNVSKSVKVPVYIDDTNRIDYPSGIIVNGTIYAENINYPQKNGTTYLLGRRYIPIRREFWDVPEKTIKENIESIMVTFGGDDARNMTLKVMKLLIEHYPELAKNVVIGKGFQNIKEIEKMADKSMNLIYFPDAEGMKRVMLESDIAISAGGQTLYELARVGVPTIAILVADNQMNNIRGWQRAGFIEYAGWWEDEDILNNIIQKIELLQDANLRQEKAKRGKALVDGLGAIRTVTYCIKTFFDNSLILRKAEIKDMYNIYELSNDLDVRQNSFNPSKIELETHKNWFINKLESENCLFLVAEINDKFIGQVRFDINGDKAAISISILRHYRGLGAGQVITQRAINLLLIEHPDVLSVKAYVKRGNIQSAMLFEKSGFQFVKDTIVKGQDAMEYLYQCKHGI